MTIETVFSALAYQVRRLCGLTDNLGVEAMTEALSKVELGAEIEGADATGADVLSGKKFVGKNGYVESGSMPENGTVDAVLDASVKSVSIAKGHHSGSGSVSVHVQEKTVTPGETEVDVVPDSGYLLEKVTVKSVESSKVYTGTVYGNDPANGGYKNSITVDTGVEVSENDTFILMAASGYYVDYFDPDFIRPDPPGISVYLATAIRRNPDEAVLTWASTEVNPEEGYVPRITSNVAYNGDGGYIDGYIDYSGTKVTVSGEDYYHVPPIMYIWYLIK